MSHKRKGGPKKPSKIKEDGKDSEDEEDESLNEIKAKLHKLPLGLFSKGK